MNDVEVDEVRCETCAAWEVCSPGGSTGYCRKRPLTVDHTWPRTRADAWCLAWKPRRNRVWAHSFCKGGAGLEESLNLSGNS